MLLLQNKPWLVEYKTIRAIFFLPEHGMEWKTIFPYSIRAIFFHSIFHSILKFSAIFHSILPYQGKFKPEATRSLYCVFVTLSIRGGVEDTRLEAKAKDQGHKCKCFPKKKGLKKFFSVDLKKKNGLENHFVPIYKILTIQKIVLTSSRGQGNFRGLEASRPRPRTWKCALKDSTSVKRTFASCHSWR